jgi:hypothetical protein
MKKNAYTSAILAIAASMFNPDGYPYQEEPVIRKTQKASQQELNRRKGLKMFLIDGQQVWAINKKNAIRKARKTRPC